MPAKRKTKQDRLRDTFGRMYKVGKAESDMKDSDIARMLGVTEMTLRAKRNNPSDFKLGQVAALALVFRWTGNEIADLVSMMQ